MERAISIIRDNIVSVSVSVLPCGLCAQCPMVRQVIMVGYIYAQGLTYLGESIFTAIVFVEWTTPVELHRRHVVEALVVGIENSFLGVEIAVLETSCA